MNSRATLERVRTFLVTHTPLSASGTAPRTFGEAVQARQGVATTVQRLIDVAVVLTLVVAGCSLAVAVGGSLVERKRPFTLLRVTGTPMSVLYRVVLLEAVLPLAAATIVAGGIAYGLSVLTVQQDGAGRDARAGARAGVLRDDGGGPGRLAAGHTLVAAAARPDHRPGQRAIRVAARRERPGESAQEERPGRAPSKSAQKSAPSELGAVPVATILLRMAIIPEKPSLSGLEAKWGADWQARRPVPVRPVQDT